MKYPTLQWPLAVVLTPFLAVSCSKTVDSSTLTMLIEPSTLAVGGVQKATLTLSGKNSDGATLGPANSARISVSTGTIGTGTAQSVEGFFSVGGTFVTQFACPASPTTITVTAISEFKQTQGVVNCVADTSVVISMAVSETAISLNSSTSLSVTVTDSTLTSSDGGSNSNNKTITVQQTPVLGTIAGPSVSAQAGPVNFTVNGGVGTLNVTFASGALSTGQTTLKACITGSSICVESIVTVQDGRAVNLDAGATALTFGATTWITATVKQSNAAIADAGVIFEQFEDAGTFSIPDGGAGVSVTLVTDSQGIAAVNFTAGNTAFAATTLRASVVGGLTSERKTMNVSIQLGKTLTLSVPSSLPTGGIGDISVLVTQGTSDGGVPTPYTSPVTVRFSSSSTGDGGDTFSPDAGGAFTSTLDKLNTTGTNQVTAKVQAGSVVGGHTITAAVVGGFEQATTTLSVTQAAVGSIEFCAPDSTSLLCTSKSSPNPLVLGLIGSRKPQQAQIVFIVKNELGKAYTDGQSVTFAVSDATTSGARLVNDSAVTSIAAGLVTTTLTAGSNLQNVTVRATTSFGGQSRSVDSQRVSIVAGVPAWNKSVLTCTNATTATSVIPGAYYGSVPFTCNVVLGDRFGNFADPSQVNFLSEAGIITAYQTSDTATGIAAVTGTSAGGRPYNWNPGVTPEKADNGFVNVIAFTRGEEFFYDRNSSGVLDNNPQTGKPDKCPASGTTLSGAYLCYNNPGDGGALTNDCYCDLPEPFVDKNDNDLFETGIAEEFRDAPSNADAGAAANGIYDTGNTQWDNDTIIWWSTTVLWTTGIGYADFFEQPGGGCDSVANGSAQSTDLGTINVGASKTLCVRYHDDNYNCAGVGGIYTVTPSTTDLVVTPSLVYSETFSHCAKAMTKSLGKLPHNRYTVKNVYAGAARTAVNATISVTRSGGLGTPTTGEIKTMTVLVQ